MKTKLFLLALVALLCAACEKKTQENQELYTGHIFGTMGCTDENYTTFYKGYFIATNSKDTLLSFNLDVQDSISVSLGTHRIPDIEIPYSFYVTILTPSDKRYIHYALPIEDAAHQPVIISKSWDEIQALITPCQ